MNLISLFGAFNSTDNQPSVQLYLLMFLFICAKGTYHENDLAISWLQLIPDLNLRKDTLTRHERGRIWTPWFTIQIYNNLKYNEKNSITLK